MFSQKGQQEGLWPSHLVINSLRKRQNPTIMTSGPSDQLVFVTSGFRTELRNVAWCYASASAIVKLIYTKGYFATKCGQNSCKFWPEDANNRFLHLFRRSPLIRVRLAVPSYHVIMSRSADEEFAVVDIPPENVTMPDGQVCPDHFRGWLLKWTNYIKGYQKRWFVLSNGLLSYYRYWGLDVPLSRI